MARRTSAEKPASPTPAGKSSALFDTRVIYCGDNLEQLRKLPYACLDLKNIVARTEKQFV